MEHNHGGLVQIIFLSKWVICRFHLNLPGCSWGIMLFKFKLCKICQVCVLQHLLGIAIDSLQIQYTTRKIFASEFYHTSSKELHGFSRRLNGYGSLLK